MEKNVSHEPRGREGIKTHMKRMDLRKHGVGRVNWNYVREYH